MLEAVGVMAEFDGDLSVVAACKTSDILDEEAIEMLHIILTWYRLGLTGDTEIAPVTKSEPSMGDRQ